MVRIVIKTEPTAKGRAKTSYRNGRVWTYTPRKTQEAENVIKERLTRHLADKFPAHVPVKLTAVFYRTKSKYLKRSEILPVRKPDLDNLLKLLLDSMNGLLVSDDAQITTIKVSKRWTTEEHPFIRIKLENDKLSED